MRKAALVLATALAVLLLGSAAPHLRGWLEAELRLGDAGEQTGSPLSGLAFLDGAGRPLTLADFKGKVVLLNVWATWCAPCREEMPALDRLSKRGQGRAFAVVALAIDGADPAKVEDFYRAHGIADLAVYRDAGDALRTLGVAAIPATLVIDEQGRELDRIAGPVDWDALEISQIVNLGLRNAIASAEAAAPPSP